MATIQDSMKRQLSRAMSPHGTSASPHTVTESPQATTESRQAVSNAVARPPGFLRNLEADSQIFAGNAGDHKLISQLLGLANQSSLADDFQSRLDEPQYLPSDRLVIRRNEQLVGHVQVSKLVGWFHGQRCPMARLQDFVTLPEYRSAGFDAPLLEVAESVAINEGAIFGFVRTDRPEWFEQQGWSCCRGQGHTRANTRAILSHLDAHQSRRKHHTSTVEIRSWRHFQLESILKLYQQLSTGMWGTLQRSLENWQWLVGRKAHDQILIAVEKEANPAKELVPPEDLATEDLTSDPHRQIDIVGYAIVRDSCIVEMLTLPGHSAVRSQLLLELCRDAIDLDHHFISLHTPAADPMHELLVTAGGSWIAENAASTGRAMLKLLAPDRWVERLYPLLHERAREAGIARPLEIDFAVGEKTLRLTLTRRSSRLEPIGHSAAAIQCSSLTLQDLLTSNLTFPEAIAQGRLRTPHLSLLRTLAALFPPKLFWQSAFPLLRL